MILRHTFTTRMCEAGVNVKVIQDTLGHRDISTTLNIYTDVTKELRKSEFECRFDNDELQNQEEAKEERICLGESQLRGRTGKLL